LFTAVMKQYPGRNVFCIPLFRRFLRWTWDCRPPEGFITWYF